MIMLKDMLTLRLRGEALCFVGAAGIEGILPLKQRNSGNFYTHIQSLTPMLSVSPYNGFNNVGSGVPKLDRMSKLGTESASSGVQGFLWKP